MDELIESHLGYARAIAANLLRKYPPCVTLDDLEGAAELGLVQAARNYDPAKCVSFSTFAFYRVHGAIFDEVRKSWRAAHITNSSQNRIARRIRKPESAGEPIENERDSENIDPVQDTFMISLDSMSAKQVECIAESPANAVLRKEKSEVLRAALKLLPQRQRLVLQAHYFEDVSLVSIGRQLNLSKSWVSRLHAQALEMLREILLQPTGSSKANQ